MLQVTQTATPITTNVSTEAATNVTTGGANVTNVTEAANVTANVTKIWLVEYDEANFTKEMIVANMTERGVYNNFALWFMTFFGPNGVVVKDLS